jgi:hypothetical protein
MTEAEKKKAGLSPYCACGSGECREAKYDGYGIFLTYTCPKCYREKMRGFRSDIDDRYECDEAIEAD